MQKIFHHNHQEPKGSYIQAMKARAVAIDRAVSLHPIKEHLYQYHLAAHMCMLRSKELRHRSLLYQRQVYGIDRVLQDRDEFFNPNRISLPPGLQHFDAQEIDDVLIWDYFTKHAQFSHRTVNPRPGLTSSMRLSTEDVAQQIMAMINADDLRQQRVVDYKDIWYGYSRVDPLHGAHYILNMRLVYREYRGKKVTRPTKRHVYVQQPFTEIEFTEDRSTDLHYWLKLSRHRREASKHFINILKDYATSPGSKYAPGHWEKKKLIFIVALSGRHDIFLKFLTNFEVAALQMEKHVELFVMFFTSNNPALAQLDADIVTAMNKLQERYTQHKVKVIHMDGNFSRGVGLQYGANLHPPNALLVFMDVDMRLNHNTLNRIKLNTIQGKQVYYPIFFSQFDPDSYCTDSACKQTLANPFRYGPDVGYWRTSSFGLVSLYNSDFKKIGGFDTSIKGWGLEDLLLYEAFVNNTLGIRILRAPDPGIVHNFHPIMCDPTTTESQYNSCLGTLYQTYGSSYRLAENIYKVPEIIHKDSEHVT